MDERDSRLWGDENAPFHGYRFVKVEPHPYVRIVSVDHTALPKMLEGSFTNKDWAKKAVVANIRKDDNHE